MKKKILLSLVLLGFCILNIFAYGNTSLFNSTKDIRVISTEHFNIIYNNQSSLLAKDIYQNCEDLFNDICDNFDFSIDHSFNVVVTADIQQFNSYFASFPNEIVIFDTVTTNNYYNYFYDHFMLNVFKHELTHALSLTDDNKFITNIFGKLFSPANIFLTSFQKEGITVNSESQDGQGRLNNPSYDALLYESKIEGNFPSYFDVQGLRDIPSNANYYLFGAYFYQYLIDTYGVENFNKYWEMNSNWNVFLIFPNYSFKEVYNITIEQAWKAFENSIEDISINYSIDIKTIENIYPKYIVGSGTNVFIGDYFQNNTEKFDKENFKLSSYSSSFADLGEITANKDTIVLSKYNNSAQPLTYTRVVNQNGSYTYDIDSFRLAILLDSTTLVGVKNEGEIEYLQWIDTNNLKVMKTFNLKDNEAVQNIAVNSSNDIVFTSRIGESNYLSILSAKKRVLYKLGERVSIEGLNIYQDKAVLTTIRDGELGRLTLIDLASGRMDYMDSNILGGVYSPTMLDDNTILFISKYYDRSNLSVLYVNDINFNTVYLEKSLSENLPKKQSKVTIDGFRKYNPLDFIFDDKLFIPYFRVAYNSNDKFVYSSTGFSYNIADPLQVYSLSFSPSIYFYDGYQVFSFNTSLTKKLANNEISVNSTLKKCFNTYLNNAYLFNLFLSNSYTYDLRNHDSFLLQSSVEYTKTNFIFQYKFGASLMGSYNYSRQVGKNLLSTFSYNLAMGLYFYNYYKYFSGVPDANSYKIVAQASLNIPYLIPQFDSYYSSSSATNLSCILWYEIYTKNLVFSGEINTVLYSREIQKGYNFILPFYFNRIIFLTGLNVEEFSPFNSDGEINLVSSEIFLKAYLTNSLDTTSILSAPYNIGAKLYYSLLKQTFNVDLLLSI